LAEDATRRLVLRMTHPSPRQRVVEELTDGFERSARKNSAALKERRDRLLAAVSDLSEGQALTLTYVPSQGTTLQSGSGTPVTLPGKDFADAVFSIWLGRAPLDEHLKAHLLGNS
jgi:hypothetical protein